MSCSEARGRTNCRRRLKRPFPGPTSHAGTEDFQFFCSAPSGGPLEYTIHIRVLRGPQSGKSTNSCAGFWHSQVLPRQAQLGRSDEAMLDATAEQERQAVGINPPHQRADPKRGSLRGNELQPDRGPGLQPRVGHNLRTVRADVYGLACVSTSPCFDDNRPRDPGARVLPPVLLWGHCHLSAPPRSSGEDSPTDDSQSQQLTCPGEDAIRNASYEAVSEPPASTCITGVRFLTRIMATASTQAFRGNQATLG